MGEDISYCIQKVRYIFCTEPPCSKQTQDGYSIPPKSMLASTMSLTFSSRGACTFSSHLCSSEQAVSSPTRLLFISTSREQRNVACSAVLQNWPQDCSPRKVNHCSAAWTLWLRLWRENLSWSFWVRIYFCLHPIEAICEEGVVDPEMIHLWFSYRSCALRGSTASLFKTTEA